MISLSDIEQHLGAHDPVRLDIGGHKHAAVALVLRQSHEQDVEALFIERARYQQDPWSGQINGISRRYGRGVGWRRETSRYT